MSTLAGRNQSSVVLINQSFSDFGQFESAIDHWNLDFTLLGSGGFQSHLHYSTINQCIIGKATFQCALEQRGTAPKGMRTFVIPVNDQVSYRWRHHEITGNTLQLFPKNGELYSVSGSNFSCYVISFPEPHFLAVAESMGHDLYSARWEEAFVWLEHDNHCLNSLRDWCRSYQEGLADRSNTLLRLLINSLAGSQKLLEKGGNHQNLVLAIHSLLRHNPGEVLKVQDLVNATGFSERTLQYAFKSLLGVSPMDYVKRHRLKSVYNEIYYNKKRSIVDIANKYGFWHMGQFAQDFRKVYGVLPSELLKNAYTLTNRPLAGFPHINRSKL